MQKTVKPFFVFSLLLVFLSSVSGISVSLEHAKHSTSKKAGKENNKEKGAVLSQGDQCHCALHLQMNTCLIPETQKLEHAFISKNSHEIPHLKISAYRCLIDYFSSRAPPCLS